MADYLKNMTPNGQKQSRPPRWRGAENRRAADEQPRNPQQQRRERVEKMRDHAAHGRSSFRNQHRDGGRFVGQRVGLHGNAKQSFPVRLTLPPPRADGRVKRRVTNGLDMIVTGAHNELLDTEARDWAYAPEPEPNEAMRPLALQADGLPPPFDPFMTAAAIIDDDNGIFEQQPISLVEQTNQPVVERKRFRQPPPARENEPAQCQWASTEPRVVGNRKKRSRLEATDKVTVDEAHFPIDAPFYEIAERILSVVPFLPLRQGHSETYATAANQLLRDALASDGGAETDDDEGRRAKEPEQRQPIPSPFELRLVDPNLDRTEEPRSEFVFSSLLLSPAKSISPSPVNSSLSSPVNLSELF